MKKPKRNKEKTLKDLIKKQYYTIAQFCRDCGVSLRHYYSISNGEKTPSVDVAIAMCKTLKISFKELMTYLGKDVSGVPNDE